MNKDKVILSIKSYLKDLKSNPTKYEDENIERFERKKYYQSFTKEKILSMSEEEFYEYISNLWSMLLWGNKQYVVDKLIKDNGFVNIKKELVNLLYSAEDISVRWDNFLKKNKRFRCCFYKRNLITRIS